MCYPYTICKCPGKPGCDTSKSDNTTYTGPDLPFTGIETNDNMTLVIQKLNDAIAACCSDVPPPGCTTYRYKVKVRECSDCSTFQYDDVINNATPLQTGYHYYFASTNQDALVSEFVGCFDIPPQTFLQLLNGRPTCMEACPPCVSYRYKIKTRNCTDCSEVLFDDVINNASLLQTGYFYYVASTNEVHLVTEFVGCTNIPASSFLSIADRKTTCIIACTPTTTTTTTT